MAKFKANPSKNGVAAASVRGKMNPGQQKELTEHAFQSNTNQQFKKD
ncbi:YuzL-like protein [Schinkia azotoformans MEV2011]|uniref:YuzL-like protein n=1 Tax=Schinkia azotoformans MEV2011 TaxID=1348973 RepID=A0A072NGS3_SCHAZ|nr:YuzL family protein [Schinkia azotoformans]KEF36701.1 YuzL-like protein [Schinkia azotoformans MEV2011]MEC1638971.1 YuzL family protein [Schinkia azotoformans]MEC1695408.1 YuzL family protein [Schinkia azotoformans]MEC1715087.1 YuzL family protein [Schinkia azotoformans]MEC1722360.1 YuzL family protein [Schinkia azotoformans]